MRNAARPARGVGSIAGVLVAGTVSAAVFAHAGAAAAPGAAAARTPCSASVPGSAIGTQAGLRASNRLLARLGNRPTGSPAQQRYIRWIMDELRRVPGVEISTTGFRIRRWDAHGASLKLAGQSLPIAGAIPYSGGTPAAGVTAPLTALADDVPITAANSRGRIVVRPAPAGVVPLAVFTSSVLGWSANDPDGVFSSGGSYRRDFLFYTARLQDLLDAGSAGAAGIVFVKDRPRAQILGHTEPYEGLHYPTPGVFVGADEGARLQRAAAGGGSATIAVAATTTPTTTRSVTATIPGRSAQRIVIDSHTDGTNAVEDNGPIAMVAMARYVAGLPLRCRAKTVQFAFSTAHFYQRVAGPNAHVRDGGAEQFAKRLDRDYDRGTVAAVIVLEHLGALAYDVAERADGRGTRLVATKRPEPTLVAVSDSRPLVAATASVIKRHHVDATALLQGADAKGNHVPAHCSFGGEGTPYNRHLLPTVATIAAPATLYDPHWGVDGIDFARMREQALAFTELVRRLDGMSRAAIAGTITADRTARDAGAPTCPWFK